MNQPRQQPEEVPSAAVASATSKKRFIREFLAQGTTSVRNLATPPGSCAARPVWVIEGRRRSAAARRPPVLSTTSPAQLKKSIPRANPAQASLAAKATNVVKLRCGQLALQVGGPPKANCLRSADAGGGETVVFCGA